jgi:hypothetical protein
MSYVESIQMQLDSLGRTRGKLVKPHNLVTIAHGSTYAWRISFVASSVLDVEREISRELRAAWPGLSPFD